MANDLAVLVPATYRLSFPRKPDGVPVPGTPWTVDVTLASLSLADYGGVTGRPARVHTEYSAAWASFTSPGTTPDNATELTALAAALATSFYLWMLGRALTEYGGAVPWVMEGHTDLVELRHRPETLSTACSRGEWRPDSSSVELPQHSPTTGSHSAPSDTTNFIDTTVLIGGSTSFYVGGTSTSYFQTGATLNFYAPTWNFRDNLTFNVTTGKTLTFSGGLQIIFNTPVELCGWLWWCWEDYDVSGASSYNNLVAPVGGDGNGEPGIRLISAAGDYSITGIDASIGSGQVLALFNATTHTLTLNHQNASSSAANRFRCPGNKDFHIAPGGSAIVWLDGSASLFGWRVMSEAEGVPPGEANYILGADAASSTREWKQLIAGSNISITHGANAVTFATTGVPSGSGTQYFLARWATSGTLDANSYVKAQTANYVEVIGAANIRDYVEYQGYAPGTLPASNWAQYVSGSGVFTWYASAVVVATLTTAGVFALPQATTSAFSCRGSTGATGTAKTGATVTGGIITNLGSAVTINGTSFDGTGSITVTAAAGTLTGATLNSTVVTSSLTSVGTLTGLTVIVSDAATNATSTGATFGHDTSGTAAAGFGSVYKLQLQDSTTADVDAANLTVTWATATHASRKARVVLNVYDTAVREGLRVEASGSAPMIGFLGANASAALASPDLGTLATTFGLATGTPTFAAANLSGTTLPAAVVTSSLTSVGTIGTGVWQGTAVAIPNGGTGQATAVAAKDALTVKGADIASATTTDLSTATGELVFVTGTTTITGLGTVAAGAERVVKFTGALTLTHNATSLILPTSANITTAASDRAAFRSLGSGNWICTVYQRADGTALASSGGSGTVTSVASGSGITGGTITTTGTLSLDVTGLTAADAALADEIPEYNIAATANRKLTLAKVGGIVGPNRCGLRLAPTNDPYLLGSTTGYNGFYFVPVVSDKIILWDGTRDLEFQVAGGTTVTLSGTSANTKYYIYALVTAGALAWEFSTTAPVVDPTSGVASKTSDRTRMYMGVLTTNGSANQYDHLVGTRNFANYWNLAPYTDIQVSSTSSWSQSGNGTWAATNAGNATFKTTFTVPWAKLPVKARCTIWANGTYVHALAADGTTLVRTNTTFGGMGTGSVIPTVAEYSNSSLSLGQHYVQSIETTSSAAAATAYGHNGGTVGGGTQGVQSGLVVEAFW